MTEINERIVIQKYKHEIENSVDHGFLQGVQQAVLGWHTTNFVKENIKREDLKILLGKEELLTSIVAQNMAIGKLKREKVAASDKTFIDKDDLETPIKEVIQVRESFSEEEIKEATIKFRDSVISKEQSEQKKMEETEKKNRNKGRRFI